MDSQWLTVVLEEYKTLRTEIISSMQSQKSTLRMGIAAVGALFVVAFQLWDQPLISTFILLLLLPVMSYLVLIIWLGEVSGMHRIGTYLIELEERVNRVLDQSNGVALAWESSVRKAMGTWKSRLFISEYRAIVLLFLTVAISSIVVGVVRVHSALSLETTAVIVSCEVLLLILVLCNALYARKLCRSKWVRKIS